MRPYSPGGVLNALASAPGGSKPLTPSTHRLRRGLPGYLILFAPHAFASQRQSLSRRPPSPPVFRLISTNFTSTPSIPPSSQDSSLAVSDALPRLSQGLSHPTCSAAYTRFTPSDSEQRLHPLSYRGCWHRVSRCLLRRYRHQTGYWPALILPSPQSFTTRGPSSLTRRRCVRLSPIAQNSPLLPPVGVWTVSQFQCGCSSSQTSYPSMPW